jgi:hypothetical protein
MLFAQLAGSSSIRDIVNGLMGVKGKLIHLGITNPTKSSISYANSHRPWEFFERLFHEIYAMVQKKAAGAKKKFKFKNPLYSIDSSTINLCLEVFDWALYKKTKGAVKLHLMLEHQNYLPCRALVTNGKVADISALRSLTSLPKGAIVVMDRGYFDFKIFGQWIANGIFFVTRIKDSILYEVVENHDVPRPKDPSKSRVLMDQTIAFTSDRAKKLCPNKVRLVTVRDEEKDRTFSFVTNNFRLSAATIGNIYKDRWSIEAFFKAIKQNHKIKAFLGTSENAVKTQLWTALIAILLLKLLQLQSTFNWSLSNLIATFRLYLLMHMDLMKWVNDPLGNKPPDPLPNQEFQGLWPYLGQQ